MKLWSYSENRYEIFLSFFMGAEINIIKTLTRCVINNTLLRKLKIPVNDEFPKQPTKTGKGMVVLISRVQIEQ